MDSLSRPTADDYPRALLLTVLALVVASANSTIPSPLYHLLQQQMHFSATVLTSIYAIHSVGVLTTLLTLGRLSDRIGDRRRVLVPALLCVFFGALSMASAHSVGGLLAGRLISGLGVGALTGSASAAIVELVPAAMRKRAALFGTSAITFGCAIGPLFDAAALWTGLLPTRLPFVLVMLGAAGTAVALTRVRWPKGATLADVAAHAGTDTAMSAAINDTDRSTAGSGQPAKWHTLTSAPFLIASGALGLVWCAGTFVMTLAPSLADSLMHIHDPAAIALLLSLFQLVTGATQLAARRLPSHWAAIGGSAMAAVMLLVCTAAAWLQLPWLFAAGTVLLGLGYGSAFVGAAAVVNQEAPERARATVVSMFYVIGYAICTLPILAFGTLSDLLGITAATALFTVFILGFGAAIVHARTRLPAY